MMTQLAKKSPFLSIMDSTLVSLPAPANISYMWNFGSLLSLCLMIQIVTGVLLACAYSSGMETSFTLLTYLMETSQKGWFIRYIHANGASLFFICMYLHIGRGLYYSSFLFMPTWFTGVMILLMTMATAFLGYVLPMNQMSYWGASVITNLFSEVPYVGKSLIQLIWGGTSVHNPTLSRFFTFHFLLPFIILALVVAHITLLHETGSNNPLGLVSNSDKIFLHPYFSIKDLLGVLFVSSLFLLFCLYYPLTLGDNENFTVADMSATPHHIQPEWYFLFAYAILRSIPNKLGGVIALLLSVLILYIPPLTTMSKMKSTSFYPLNKLIFWLFIFIFILLTWIGMRPVEPPYVLTGQILTSLYFIYFMLNPLTHKMWDNLNTFNNSPY
uniref:Cytochrome b n=1 Tax=Pseudocrangonyx daejeonensis TaxID=2038767 RepID=A0A346SAG5_9CRUS|nr:cytochrome b [Pseudocrangonyx daejeonensis]AXT17553.1 cytochrome b [Pseudocrangonyx daejeonensis]